MSGEAPEKLVEPDADPVERAADRLRRVASCATAALLLLSWPLWTGRPGWPRVPFLMANVTVPVFAEKGLAVALLAGVAGTGLARRWRPWFAVSLVSLIVLAGGDQHRFQPWSYQYAMTGLVLAALPGKQGLRYARWWFAALYLHSGLSKLDVSFCDELGLDFLKTALASQGIDPLGWGRGRRTAAVLLMPAGEIAVAAALAFSNWRRIGRIGAAVLHGTLIVILGPLGLDHSAIVLAWNAAMLIEVWIAFGPDLTTLPEPRPSRWGKWRSAPVQIVFWTGVVLPIGERWEFFDAWPSHALYASHVGRVLVSVHESELEEWPEEVRRHLRMSGAQPWKVLNLTEWSREVRGTPIYPQRRAGIGLAEALAARYRGRLIRVVVLGPANRWTGIRRREVAVGLDAIRALGDRYWLNAHPINGSSCP